MNDKAQPDINDTHRAQGPDAVRERHDRAHKKAPAQRKAKDVLLVTDYAAMNTTSRKTWVVHHLLGAGEISVWYGEPGSGKSVLAEDLGLHVAAGRTWHGRKVGQGAVLYVALERAAVVARRAIAFGLEHEFAGAVLPFAMLRGSLDLREPKIATGIVATLKDLAQRHDCKPTLIGVDTVSRALNGGDENSPKDMGALIATLSCIQAAMPDVHILLTHHTPQEKGRMRGHGALLGAVDTTLHVTKGSANRLAEVVKSSDHEEGQRIAFTLKSVVVDQDEYGDPITSPVVVEDDTPSPAGRRSTKEQLKGAAAKVALNALSEAISEMGAVPPASNHIPPATKAVSVDQWRDYAYRRGISASEEPRARQAAFQRAVHTLRATNLVGIWEPHAWLS